MIAILNMNIMREMQFKFFFTHRVADIFNGNIDIRGASEAVFAKTISGFVDLSWPKSKGATVAMKTITGEVYSNLAIDFKTKREKHPIVGYQLEGDVLGGGPSLKLESISNHIYLRQQE